ncbi:hypothetical protein Sru01_05190 [Sphaerisporangium rufum]|uniref:Uncharacterized protein n=1 Tax=Sphaerisporangium rufum TaxID=1381558 RepID=A0A919UYV2_9ACTN|nr:hypothetical protein [Sphaerisporangium rufum]GII75537.1 hypothetical protein Sru01_05190 [Sphaerisporangium rufum]
MTPAERESWLAGLPLIQRIIAIVAPPLFVIGGTARLLDVRPSGWALAGNLGFILLGVVLCAANIRDVLRGRQFAKGTEPGRFDVVMRGYRRSQVDAYIAAANSPAGTPFAPEFDVTLRGYNPSQVHEYITALPRRPRHDSPG